MPAVSAPPASYRTPDERFADLPGLPWEHRLLDWNGLRLAALDVGEGRPVVMLHGQPTWSYLYRKAIPPLAAAGYRCVAPDLPGFGRSDKPLDERWYSFDRHAAALSFVLEELDLRDAVLVMHDWGGPLGLHLATALVPERVGAFVAMDTGVLTGGGELGATWHAFRDLVEQRPDLPVGKLVRMGCRRRPERAVLDAYDAPFPDAAAKAGPRAFPQLVPLTPDAPAAAAGREAAAALAGDTRPALLLWAESDPIFPMDTHAPGLRGLFPDAGEIAVIEGAGHFLQEDAGERIGELIAAWLG